MLDRYKAGTEPSLEMAVRIARSLGLPLDALVYDGDVAFSERDSSEGAADAAAIPLLSVHASAGAGVSNDQVEVIERIAFSRPLLRRLGANPEHAHFIFARGDSMEPTIADGAMVLIDASRRRLSDDGIYAIVVDGDVRLKRVQKRATGAVELISDNARYPSETLQPDEVERLVVAGKAFWSGSGV